MDCHSFPIRGCVRQVRQETAEAARRATAIRPESMRGGRSRAGRFLELCLGLGDWLDFVDHPGVE